MRIEATEFPDLKAVRQDSGAYFAIMTDEGLEACTGEVRFACGRRVLSSYREICEQIDRILKERFPMDWPRGFRVTVTERDLCYHLTECCPYARMLEYLQERGQGLPKEVSHWLETRSWDVRPVTAREAEGMNLLFNPKRRSLATDGGVNTLRSLVLPSSVDGCRVERLEPYALAAYRELEELEIPDSVLELPEFVCHGFMTLKRVSISKNVRVIPRGAFGKCRLLKTVRIPEGIEEIGTDAFFMDCSIERLRLPDSIRRVEGCAFVGIRRLEYHGSAPGYPWGASRVVAKVNY